MHNVTLNSFVWSSMNLIRMFIIFNYRKRYWKYHKLTLLNLEKRQYLPHYWSDKGFKCTVVDRTLLSLHGGSLEITPTQSLKRAKLIRITYHRIKNDFQRFVTNFNLEILSELKTLEWWISGLRLNPLLFFNLQIKYCLFSTHF